jgi:glucuronoarabinoxylan endo-1,4-beta-xylanase
MNRALVSITSVSVAIIVAGCSGSSSTTPQPSGQGGSAAGGASQTGGSNAGTQGGTSASNVGGGGASTQGGQGGDSTVAGGSSSTPQGGSGGNPTGGVANTSTGGAPGTATGGKSTTGGANTTTGGKASTSTGGKASTSTGGTSAAGGTVATGGAVSTSTGGKASTSTGGTSAVSTTAAGGATGGTPSTSTGVTVQCDSTHQTIQGFGINDTWQPIPSAKVAPLFNPTSGIGMSILRIGMNYTSTATAVADYNSGEASNISAAKSAAGSDFKVIGSVWTAPSSCRDNNTRDKTNSAYGGHLMTSCYESWASAIAAFASARSLYAMGVANEPDFVSCGSSDPCNGNYDTMAYTANEMTAFIKVVGPKLKAVNVKVIAAEASEWIHQWSNISAAPSPSGKNSSDPLGCGCFGMTIDAATIAKCAAKCASGDGYDYGHVMAADATAWGAFDIIGLHQYDSQIAYAWPSDVTAAKKEIWQTEMSGVKWWPEVGPSSDIANGIAVAGWIHSALTVGDASAWIWWWHAPMSGGTNDNEGIWLQNGDDTKRHYTIGNYSKFVRPGYKRVDVNGNSNADLLISAYTGTGTVAIVVINKGTTDVTVPITIAGGTAPTSCTPNLTAGTISDNNLKAGTAVTVSGGAFSASLVKQSVTTFVCK